MIQSLKAQLLTLKVFLKANWFLVGIGMGGVYMATPRMELIADEFLGDVFQEGLEKREANQIKRIDSLNTIQLFRIDSMNQRSDSIHMIEMMHYIDSTNIDQNKYLEDHSESAVVNKMNQILSDTIPWYENGREVGYYIIYIKPDGTPIVNKYNSIFNEHRK